MGAVIYSDSSHSFRQTDALVEIQQMRYVHQMIGLGMILGRVGRFHPTPFQFVAVVHHNAVCKV